MLGEEKEWPLDVYRRTTRGWEKQIPEHMTGNSEHTLQPNATGIPKVGCIVIKRFRLKIVLASNRPAANDSPASTPEEREQQHNKKPAAEDQSCNLMQVIRRNDCLLLNNPKKKLRTVLLKFTSVKDCVEFSDELVRLNRSLYQPSSQQQPRANSVTNDGRQAADNSAPEIQRNEVFSHIVRLLYDDSFMNFTEEIEKLIQSSPDGAKILESLQGHGGTKYESD